MPNYDLLKNSTNINQARWHCDLLRLPQATEFQVDFDFAGSSGSVGRNIWDRWSQSTGNRVLDHECVRQKAAPTAPALWNWLNVRESAQTPSFYWLFLPLQQGFAMDFSTAQVCTHLSNHRHAFKLLLFLAGSYVESVAEPVEILQCALTWLGKLGLLPIWYLVLVTASWIQ